MNNTIPKKLTVLAAGVALAVPLWAAGAASRNASPTRIERLDRIERLEKLQKLERLDKEGKLNKAQTAALHRIMTREASSFDAFLKAHPAIAEDIKQDPQIINSPAFITKNPALAAWFKANPIAAEAFRDNPQGFLKLAVSMSVNAKTNGQA
jgi:hypothetical protein